jgi:hypothetical protein
MNKNDYSLLKDNITYFLINLNENEITWRQARIKAIQLCKLAKVFGVNNQISFKDSIQMLMNTLKGLGPFKSYKPKTFELWFLKRTYYHMKYII